jgi:MFS family permease
VSCVGYRARPALGALAAWLTLPHLRQISSAVSLVNTILPLLAGVLIDYYGPNIGSLTSSVFIFVGACLSALGASLSSFGLVVGGQILFGFGSTSIEINQNKWYAHYSKGVAGTPGFLGLISGLDIGLGRCVRPDPHLRVASYSPTPLMPSLMPSPVAVEPGRKGCCNSNRRRNGPLGVGALGR